MNYYAGIGSRETPAEILSLMSQMARHLALNGYTLRSGGASGADLAFEVGCDAGNGNKEIYLPWKGFNNSTSVFIVSASKAYELAEKFHPYWHNLSQGARKLQARNSHQVLGQTLDEPCAFIICYTKGGRGVGGTGQAVRLAKANNIPIFDCGLYEKDLELLRKEYRKFIKEMKL